MALNLNKNMEMVMKALTFIVSMSLALFIASAVFGDNKGPEYDQALKFYDGGNYKEAVRIFKDYVRKKPEAPAYYRIGYGLYKLGQYSEANEYFKQAYLIDPRFSPEASGVPQKYPEKKMEKSKKSRSGKKALLEKKASSAQTEAKPADAKPQALPEKRSSKEIQPPKGQQTVTTPGKKP